MGLDRVPTQRGVRRLNIRFQAIGGCITSIGDRRIGIDGVLPAGFFALARFHGRGALALDSARYSVGGLPNSRNVPPRSGSWLLALSVKIVHGPRQPSLSMRPARENQYCNQRDHGNQTRLHGEAPSLFKLVQPLLGIIRS